MIFRGKEKENHVGSHVKYCHCGTWHEGTLLEPVNYQIVVTKENPPAILSTHTVVKPNITNLETAINNVSNGNYTEKDLEILHQNLNPTMTEVESVEITDAYDITDEEAAVLVKQAIEKLLNDHSIEDKEIVKDYDY